MRREINPREARRMMQRMGMNMETVEDVTEVIIKTPNKDIVIERPEVAILQVQGQRIYQLAGGTVHEKAPERKTPTVSEEDARLVADQTGKGIEEARKALEETGGDLAKAILLLQS
jgi:nascent polypeptide-associated complex subunit alpha